MIHNISVNELFGKDNIIDIRSIEKYNDSHIPNAKNVPMILLLKNPSKYLNKFQMYYIYCQKGINSPKTCMQLSKQGYNVTNILGGYEAWLLKRV